MDNTPTVAYQYSSHINKRLMSLTTTEKHIDRAPFLHYLANCLLALLNHEVILYQKKIPIVPNGIRFKNIDASYPIFSFSHSDKISNQSLLQSHLSYLLDLTVPVIQSEEIFNAHYYFQIDNKKIPGCWEIERPISLDHRFQFPIVPTASINNLLDYCTKLIIVWQDIIEFLINDEVCLIDSICLQDSIMTIPLPSPYQPFDIGMREDGNKGTGDK
ncbi:MAG: hypothetical protein JO131_00915 [Gammaproteobacteria bacterium]|nr:hypothetical protein [Gammaproteobacteria bacterium]